MFIRENITRIYSLCIKVCFLSTLCHLQQCGAQSCNFASYATDISTISIPNTCGKADVTSAELSHLTNLQTLSIRGNALTSFPDLSQVASTLVYFNVGINSITSVDYMRISSLLKLNSLNLELNLLTEFPNLTPLGPSLKILQLSGNLISYVNTDFLKPLANLELLGLANNLLTGILDITPCSGPINELYVQQNQLSSINLTGMSNLTYIQLEANSITTFPDVKASRSSLSSMYLTANEISVIDTQALQHLENIEILYIHVNPITKLPHSVQGLAKVREYAIFSTEILTVPPILVDDITALELYAHGNVDVCKCENVWLKQEAQNFKVFTKDDPTCSNGMLWSLMTVADMNAMCTEERNQKNKIFGLAQRMTATHMALKPNLLNADLPDTSKMTCTIQCMHTTGCVSFYWREVAGSGGHCVLMAPGNSITPADVTDGDQEVWYYYAMS